MADLGEAMLNLDLKEVGKVVSKHLTLAKNTIVYNV